MLANLPTRYDENLIVGYDSSDDAAVYKLTDDIAIIQTLDFFPSMVADPYTFGQIAAANALSDIYAMGGTVISALNIAEFPEEGNLAALGEIMRGGTEKVHEAGGVLTGGHTLNDKTPKYGLSVNGIVHPDKVLLNNACQVGEVLILTKPIGVGIITSAYGNGETTDSAYSQAVEAMKTLNKYAADVMRNYSPSSCTDITGFGLLGHLTEMTGDKVTAEIFTNNIPILEDALRCAGEYLVTAGGQRNRNAFAEIISFEDELGYAMEEVLYDPQTSGGLLYSLPAAEAKACLRDLQLANVNADIIGHIIERQEKAIYVYKKKVQ